MVTRRATNAVTDIQGAVARDRGSIPANAMLKLSAAKLPPMATIPEKPEGRNMVKDYKTLVDAAY